jgi:hypothetical protein
MAKTKVSEWDSTASGNTDINGININEGCPPSTINNAIREAMAQVKDLVDGSSGDSLTNSGTLTSSGTLAITGAMTLDAAAGTSGQYLTSAGSGNTPTWVTPPTVFVSGMIMLWSGSEASIPVGWLLCDGTSSTPDLQDRFVVGAGNTYAVGANGGSADAVVVSHTHTATVSDPGHGHVTAGLYRVSGTGFGFSGTNGMTTTVTNVVNTNTTGISVSNSTTGVSGTNANLPPYYALCYIMKS